MKELRKFVVMIQKGQEDFVYETKTLMPCGRKKHGDYEETWIGFAHDKNEAKALAHKR